MFFHFQAFPEMQLKHVADNLFLCVLVFFALGNWYNLVMWFDAAAWQPDKLSFKVFGYKNIFKSSDTFLNKLLYL